MRKKRVGIIFGGCSPEYPVSLESAYSILRNIDRDMFEPVMIGISRSGEWFYFADDIRLIAEDKWQDKAVPACISSSRGDERLIIFENGGVRRSPLDVILPVLHGRNGEDGTVQGLCQLSGAALAGCGVLSSALCMDKDRAHKLVSLAGIKIPRSFCVSYDYDAEYVRAAAAGIAYPLFVKPVKAGSSFGISRLDDEGGLIDAIDRAFFYDDRVIVEEAVEGFEVGCAVLGTEKLTVGIPDEIEIPGGFFDFTEKYNLVNSKIHVPARVSAEMLTKIQETARTVYAVLDCRGFARVDMFVTAGDEIVFNEVNTIPGFTSHSRFPAMMRAARIEFKDLLTMVIEGAE